MNAAETLKQLRETFSTGLTRTPEWRKGQLRALRRMLREGERELVEAMREDLAKPETEAWVSEISFTANEIDHMLAHLDHWMAPEQVRIPLVQQPGKARVVREPFGVALVISPWNYPVQLLLAPLAAAVAAGNCVMGKPSEVTVATSAALARLVPEYLDARAIAVVEGGEHETTALLLEKFDYIFYTGGARVGRIVMEAAARHLTPVTLELGGKSPAIVARDADLWVAARRIAYGKFMNAGQTCVAPDYVLVDRSVEPALVTKLVEVLRSFYGDDPMKSPDYGRIVDARHFARLRGLLDAGGFGEVAVGGETDEVERYVAPTILREVEPGSAVMQEEIFGPILPVIPVDSLQQALDVVAAQPKPLAVYVFTRSDRTAGEVVDRAGAGAVCVNTTVVHLAIPELPFGGVGESGMGAYHGRHGFETFSHRKAVLDKPSRPDIPIQYPPYTKARRGVLRAALGGRKRK